MDTPTQAPEIDPLQRDFIPIERKTQRGTIVFKTTDNTLYGRVEEGGPIFRADRKARGKKARALDKKRRLDLRRIEERRRLMGDAKDPRTDRHPETGTPGPYTDDQPKEAPGGVGTGTKGDPAKAPAADPKKA